MIKVFECDDVFSLITSHARNTRPSSALVHLICGPCKSSQANNGSVLTKWFRRFEERDERPQPRHKARRHLPSLACEIIVFLAKVYTYVYTARAKRTERRRYEWYFHIRRHIRDRINTVSAAVYVVSHRSHIYMAVESAKAIHFSQSFASHFNRAIAFNKSILFVQKNDTLFAGKKRICNNFEFFFFILIPYLSNNKL